MKNLKDEIERILQPMFQYEVQICTKCQHSFGGHYWGTELDSCHHEGCKCVADHGGYRTEVRNDSVPESYVAELTSLIEQESERAVKDWMDYLFKEHGEWVELDEARYNNAWEQYLNQTKGDSEIH